MGSEWVTVPWGHYLELRLEAERLQRLEAAGVDNWEGYEAALSAEGGETSGDLEARVRAEVASLTASGR